MMQRIVTVNAGGTQFQTLRSTLLKFPKTPFAGQFSAPSAAAGASNAGGTSLASSSSSSQRTTGLRKKLQNSKAKRNISANVKVASEQQLVVMDPDESSGIYFVDVDSKVFASVLTFLRTGSLVLPTDDEPLRNSIVHYCTVMGILEYAFPASKVDGINEGDSQSLNATEGGEVAPSSLVQLPDVCVVQLCDHMQHDQGVKRHAMTISYGADGFRLRSLAKRIRKDLNTQLASTYWQVYQTNERAVFFVTTKVANGTADLMTTSISQQVIEHTETLGYSMVSSYVTLSPDVVHTNVRMLIHNYIFRRVRQPILEAEDTALVAIHGGGDDVAPPSADRERDGGASSSGGDDDDRWQVHPNFEPRAVGPQKSMWEGAPSVVPPGERVRDIWKK